MRRTFYVLMLGVLIVVVTGCSILEKIRIRENTDELRPASSVILDEEEAAKIMNKHLIRLYFADKDSGKLCTELRYVDLNDENKNTEELATLIVNELIKGPGKGTELCSTIPEQVKLETPVIIENSTAVVDFSKEFIENHSGEGDSEKLTIFSVVNSLTELKEIKKVKFRIEGKEKNRFKGGFKFNASFPRNTSIISKKPPVKGEINGYTQENIKEEDEDENGSKETFDVFDYEGEEILE